jgi:hypothetical protein
MEPVDYPNIEGVMFMPKSNLVSVEIEDRRGYKTTYRVRPDQVEEYKRRDWSDRNKQRTPEPAPEPEPEPEPEPQPEDEPVPTPAKARRPRKRAGDVETKGS